MEIRLSAADFNFNLNFKVNRISGLVFTIKSTNNDTQTDKII